MSGEVRVNLPGVWHAPTAPVDHDLVILEVQVGESVEEDIERIGEDKDEYEVEKGKKIKLNQ